VTEPYYRPALAFVHDAGFGFHADACAPDILALLAPLRRRAGRVLELGCGSGGLTRHLVEAGHRVVATDASEAMLDLARERVPGAAEIRRLTFPDDPLPEADAVVSVGHALNYLPDEDVVRRALEAMAMALRPGGSLAIDLCDLEWAAARRDAKPWAQVEDRWAIVTRYSTPAPNRFVRDITTFVRDDGDTWRRDDERHENVLVDAAQVPAWLAEHGVRATVAGSFGTHALPPGLVAIVGSKE